MTVVTSSLRPQSFLEMGVMSAGGQFRGPKRELLKSPPKGGIA